MKYYDKIDGLRFIAIFFVLIEHFAPIIGTHFSAGFYGVDLFFVISGFLITTILLKPNKRSFKHNYINFIGRRTLRIFPIYYIAILILWLLNFDVVRERLGWFITYTYNYAFVIYKLPMNAVSHFWSLCVEEQFYLFWPLVVLSLKNKQKLLIVFILAIILTGYAQQVFRIFPSLSAYNNVGLLTRMASLGLGALGAVLVSRQLLPDKLFRSRIVEYILFLILLASLLFVYRFKAPVLGLCSFYLVLKAANYNFNITAVEHFLKNKKIIYVGTLAYGIYVFHLPMAHYFTTYLFDPVWKNIDFSTLGKFEKIQWHSWIIKFPLYGFLSIWIASLSYKYIERPFLKLKDKYFKYQVR